MSLQEATSHLKNWLDEQNKPVISLYDFFTGASHISQRKNGAKPTRNRVWQLFNVMLKQKNRRKTTITWDQDYRNHLRVLTVPDLPSREIVCSVDRFCYISHLSAMQHWNLTNLIPHWLMLTRPSSQLLEKVYIPETQKALNPPSDFRIRNVTHPKQVRRLPIKKPTETSLPGKSVRIQFSSARVSTLGQTFVDMLIRPELCGGIQHILDAWEEHAPTRLEPIIEAVDQCSKSIVKCRAGYILEERLKITNPDIEKWKRWAQPGGSRKLDPYSPFERNVSTTWMISINV